MQMCLQGGDECLPGFLLNRAGRVSCQQAKEEAYGQSREDWSVSPMHGGLGHPLSGG